MAEPWTHGGVFDAVAEAYDVHRSGYPREIMRAAVELAGLRPGARVVEVGAGTGKLTEELVACGLRVDAVEPGSNMVEVARRRVSGSDLVRFHLVALRGRVTRRWGCSRRSFRDRRSTGSTRGRMEEGCGAAPARRNSGARAADRRARRGRRDSRGGVSARRSPDWHPRSPPSVPRPATWRLFEAGVEARRENVSEVWAWLAHPGLAVPEAEELFGPATLTGCPPSQGTDSRGAVGDVRDDLALPPTHARSPSRAESRRHAHHRERRRHSPLNPLVALVTASTLS